MTKEYIEKTRRYYDDHAPAWSESKGHMTDKSFYDEEIEFLCRLAVEKGKLLEVGVGNGREASILSSYFDYLGTDISSAMIETAKEVNPELVFEEANVLSLPFEEDSFNYFFTAATLLHISKADMGQALQELRRVTLNNGFGFISLKKGSGEELRPDQNERFFSYFQVEEYSEILKQNGFEIVEVRVKPDGRTGKPDWIEFFVKVIK